MSLKTILIDGEWVGSTGRFSVNDPFSGDELAEVSSANADLIERSIAAARTAAEKMRELPRFHIAAALRKISAGIETRKEEFSRCIALESAKPMLYARGEVERGIATFAWAAGEAER